MDEREIRGYSIIAKGDTPKVVDEETFLVPSQSSGKRYKVSLRNEWVCDCPDFQHRHKKCKHIYAVEFLLKLRHKLDNDSSLDFAEDIAENKCLSCGSANIVRDGGRKTKAGVRQRYLCKDCKKRFVLEPIKYVKGNGKIVSLAMDLYFKGLSLRDITDTIYQFYNIKLHHETVRRWIMRFTEKMNEYVKKQKPISNSSWQVDEQMIKVKGKWMWNWNVLDKDTRFLIANVVTDKRSVEDARKIFQKAKEVINHRPDTIITDGLHSYGKAIRKEFPKRKEEVKVGHKRLASITAKVQNNRVERYHSTFRERDKVMRGFKSKETAGKLAEGFNVYYNYIRPHSALNGKTPSQKANISLDLNRNRWLSLLKKSVEKQRC